jgi:methionine aminopeptidase
MTITIKDAAGIEAMRIAGRLASEVLDYLTPHVQPGVTWPTTTSCRCNRPFRPR